MRTLKEQYDLLAVFSRGSYWDNPDFIDYQYMSNEQLCSLANSFKRTELLSRESLTDLVFVLASRLEAKDNT